jgi:hypothetical protein
MSLCIWLTKGVFPPNPILDANWLRAMMQELIGTAAYVFFFLMQSDNKDIVSEIETI